MTPPSSSAQTVQAPDDLRGTVLLRQSEDRFRVLVESVRDYAIFMLDPDGHLTTWNSGAERIKGFGAAEILGRHFSCFWPPEDVTAGRCEQELERAKLEGRVEQEGWRVRKDGSRFWANVVITSIRDACGHLMGFAKVTRDLTVRRNLEQERLQRARAEEALRVRDEFLSIASHELKTPLTSVQMELFALKDRLGALVDGRAERKLDRLSRNVNRLDALIDALLDVSRIATGRLSLNPQSLELGELVAGVVDNMRFPAERAGCEVTVAAPERLVGCWDRLRIEQVLINLLSNAFRYAAGSPVAVRLTPDGGRAVMTVTDRGPGIDEQELPRIFERFARAASPQNYGGLGLGLYVSRQIVTAHSGTIVARNRLGGGTEITVCLPCEL